MSFTSMVRASTGILFGLMIASPSYAYYSVMSTGEILEEGKYTLTGETQFLTDPSGVNVAARFDSGIDESTGFRAELGVGKVDVFGGVFVKYIPYPDTEGQPAVGLNLGLLYATDSGVNEFTFRFEPLVSKKFATSFGHLTPYASVPVGLKHRTKGNDRNDLALQIAGGSEIGISKWNGLRFMAEFGVDLDHAYNYISLGVLFDFDEEGFFIVR